MHVSDISIPLVEGAPTIDDQLESIRTGIIGELSTNLLGPFSLRGPEFASLVENDSSAAISNGASPIALSASGDPSSGIPSLAS